MHATPPRQPDMGPVATPPAQHAKASEGDARRYQHPTEGSCWRIVDEVVKDWSDLAPELKRRGDDKNDLSRELTQATEEINQDGARPVIDRRKESDRSRTERRR